MIFLNLNFLGGDLSFSMMIWLFGFAARSELRVKTVVRLIVLGIIVILVMIIPVLIPYTNLFGKLIHSLIEQCSLFIVLYIAMKNFFPAMIVV